MCVCVHARGHDRVYVLRAIERREWRETQNATTSSPTYM